MTEEMETEGGSPTSEVLEAISIMRLQPHHSHWPQKQPPTSPGTRYALNPMHFLGHCVLRGTGLFTLLTRWCAYLHAITHWWKILVNSDFLLFSE